MQSIVILMTLLSMALAIPSQTYDPEYDNFNAEDLVENVRLLRSYGKCFLEKGPCTAEGSDIKKIIPEALRTSCAKCTPKQQQLVRTVARAFQSKLPDLWKELVLKEDPKGEFREAFTQFLDNSDITALKMKH
ncbi:allergen Tha p 1-like [Pararge aegeria]|uniref:Jg6690 protein n=2 Tax=Pararge aegeria TaxID=116150 RepID=A0A8S4SEA5_9NEOP|nr:allergen Tha p 1-like [Pararge aegeria]CAH2266991.1 jg6690 [Pararge aegeria aegeria]